MIVLILKIIYVILGDNIIMFYYIIWVYYLRKLNTLLNTLFK
jgi:hypothetical protein